MRTFLLLAIASFAFASIAPAQKVTLPLWPNGAPEPYHGGPEQDITKPTDALIAGRSLMHLTNVSNPTLAFYPAPAEKNTGVAIVVFPGGGYRILAYDLEGTEVCTWLNSIGVNCALVKYRVPFATHYPENTADLEDAQQAMRITRTHAAEWNIDPNRTGVLGFSAGAHLSAALSTHYDRRLYPHTDAADDQSCKPDFAFIIYPGYLALADKNMAFNPDIPVTSATPATFLLQAEDDPVHVENVTQYFLALKKAGVPAELHVYTKGGHGYGLRPTDLPITHWPALAATWLHTIGVLH